MRLSVSPLQMQMNQIAASLRGLLHGVRRDGKIVYLPALPSAAVRPDDSDVNGIGHARLTADAHDAARDIVYESKVIVKVDGHIDESAWI